MNTQFREHLTTQVNQNGPHEVSEPDAIHGIRLRKGKGEANGHNGEIFQGVKVVDADRMVRALVSMPHPELVSTAIFLPKLGVPHIEVVGPRRPKALTAAVETLRYLALDRHVGGELIIESNISSGKGKGASTADVVATIRSVANSLYFQLSAQEQSHLSVLAEKASDSVMYDNQAVVFGHRIGHPIEIYTNPLPDMTIVAFDTNPTNSVDTLKLDRAMYSSREIELLQVALARYRLGVKLQDASIIGQVATISSRINQSHLPKRRFAETLDLVKKYDALGLQVAHSGTVSGVIFPSYENTQSDRISKISEDLQHLGFADISIYKTSEKRNRCN